LSIIVFSGDPVAASRRIGQEVQEAGGLHRKGRAFRVVGIVAFYPAQIRLP